MQNTYKKLAGTSAVFLKTDYEGASPVERDGMVWQASELKLSELPDVLQVKADMASPLALEGLEDYDPASDGDRRKVLSLDAEFAYIAANKSWVHI